MAKMKSYNLISKAANESGMSIKFIEEFTGNEIIACYQL